MKLQKGMRVFGSVEDIANQIGINTGVYNVLDKSNLEYLELGIFLS